MLYNAFRLFVAFGLLAGILTFAIKSIHYGQMGNIDRSHECFIIVILLNIWMELMSKCKK